MIHNPFHVPRIYWNPTVRVCGYIFPRYSLSVSVCRSLKFNMPLFSLFFLLALRLGLHPIWLHSEPKALLSPLALVARCSRFVSLWWLVSCCSLVAPWFCQMNHCPDLCLAHGMWFYGRCVDHSVRYAHSPWDFSLRHSLSFCLWRTLLKLLSSLMMPSRPLSAPLLSLLRSFPSVFQWISSLHRWPKYWIISLLISRWIFEGWFCWLDGWISWQFKFLRSLFRVVWVWAGKRYQFYRRFP